MALDQVNVGAAPNDDTGDDLRTAFGKVNAIITNLWDTIVGGIQYLTGNVDIANGSLSQAANLGGAFGSSFVNTNSSGHGMNIQGGGTIGTRFIMAFKDALANDRGNLDDLGVLTLTNYVGTGTEDAQFTSTGAFTRIISDENLKKDIKKLNIGLNYVLKASKGTIEYNYKDEDLNAEGYKTWGFGARAVNKEYGKNPAFRPYNDIYGWDTKQMIAPAYNAISELNNKIKAQDSIINDLEKRLIALENK